MVAGKLGARDHHYMQSVCGRTNAFYAGIATLLARRSTGKSIRKCARRTGPNTEELVAFVSLTAKNFEAYSDNRVPNSRISAGLYSDEEV